MSEHLSLLLFRYLLTRRRRILVYPLFLPLLKTFLRTPPVIPFWKSSVIFHHFGFGQAASLGFVACTWKFVFVCGSVGVVFPPGGKVSVDCFFAFRFRHGGGGIVVFYCRVYSECSAGVCAWWYAILCVILAWCSAEKMTRLSNWERRNISYQPAMRFAVMGDGRSALSVGMHYTAASRTSPIWLLWQRGAMMGSCWFGRTPQRR